MRSSNLLLTVFSAIFAAFLLMVGIFFAILPWWTSFRLAFISFIENQVLVLQMIGLGLFAMGSSLLYTFLVAQKRRYYHVRSATGSVDIDEAVIQAYVDNYWKGAFPNEHISSSISIRKEEISISADLPQVPFEQQRDLLYKIEGDLKDLFYRTLNYKHPLTLSLSFPS
ncbi:MAG: hypothetical protein K0S07_925 [Chlamydiales bacterium]|jgi:hypothetical protein|nr:hypothetical protein [Chlamydiales bacterium]